MSTLLTKVAPGMTTTATADQQGRPSRTAIAAVTTAQPAGADLAKGTDPRRRQRARPGQAPKNVLTVDLGDSTMGG